MHAATMLSGDQTAYVMTIACLPSMPWYIPLVHITSSEFLQCLAGRLTLEAAEQEVQCCMTVS